MNSLNSHGVHLTIVKKAGKLLLVTWVPQFMTTKSCNLILDSVTVISQGVSVMIGISNILTNLVLINNSNIVIWWHCSFTLHNMLVMKYMVNYTETTSVLLTFYFLSLSTAGRHQSTEKKDCAGVPATPLVSRRAGMWPLGSVEWPGEAWGWK